jgi:predicted ATPase
MLKSVKINGFKSLDHIEVKLPKFAVLFGPNATGKSNFIDALQLLSRLSSERTITEALSEPMRGYPIEQFTIPDGGLPDLFKRKEVFISIESDLVPEKFDPLRYRAVLRLEPEKGDITVSDEYLARLSSRTFEPKAMARIEKEGDHLLVRRLNEAGHPRKEQLGLSYTLLSDKRFSGYLYPDLDKARQELNSWRIYYLDPRSAMRKPAAPKEVQDIGPSGENLAPFLYRLKWHKEKFRAVERTLSMAIPSIEKVLVDLDEKRGELDIQIIQEGTPYSSRIVSEGTLRVLALCAIAHNPWPGTLIAFEEPENGVHPKRLELIINLLVSIALDETSNRQVIVTTHSPVFVSLAHHLQKREKPGNVGLFICRGEDRKSIIEPFSPTGDLFVDKEIMDALESRTEDAVFQMMVRGWLGG